MKSIQDIEAVGWGFFLLAFAVLAGPCAWLTWAITSDAAPLLERAGLGVAFGALLAAITAWAVNEVLHKRNVRRFEAEKKLEKKKERKRKKHR